jgi:MATE family multidrug resistance protein
VSKLSENGNWWNRPSGAREVLILAVPLMISTSSVTLTHFVDRVFLLWYSEDAMNGSLTAGMVSWTVLSFFWGIAMYAGTFVAQYSGASQPERIGATLWTAVRFGLYTVPLFILLIPITPWFFGLFGHRQELLAEETLYFQILSFGHGAVIISQGMAAFFTGRGRTVPVMLISILAMVVNLSIDPFLIFGFGPIAPMGVEGAAWATVISNWFQVLAFGSLILLPETWNDFSLGSTRKPDWNLIRRVVRYGAPSGAQMVLEAGLFTSFMMLLGLLEKTSQSASTLAISINSLGFLPMIGLGMAVTTLVGQRIGAGSPDLAARATWTSVVIGLVYTAGFGALLLSVPKFFLLAHSSGMDPAEFEKIETLTVFLLLFVVAYCLFDTLQLIFVFAIKGAGDTFFALVAAVSVGVTSLVCSYFTYGLFEAKVYWWWTTLTAWIGTLGVVLALRFLQGKWRDMKVIEDSVIGPVVDLGKQEPAADNSEHPLDDELTVTVRA